MHNKCVQHCVVHICCALCCATVSPLINAEIMKYRSVKKKVRGLTPSQINLKYSLHCLDCSKCCTSVPLLSLM